MAKKATKKKRPAKQYPGIFEMFKMRMVHEGRYEEMMAKYNFHKEFGQKHCQAMWSALADMGYKSGEEERKFYDEIQAKGAAGYERDQRSETMIAEQLETELRELSVFSEQQKFDPVKGIEWVASVFHLEHVTPAECPHIIAWNVLQTSKKYEVAFFKDFLMKALQKGVTVESSEEFAEDESQLSDLRQAVSEAISNG